MALWWHQPHTRVYLRHDDAVYSLPFDAFDEIVEALRKPQLWWEGTDRLGAPFMLKLSDVVSVAQWDEERIEHEKNEQAAAKLEIE